MSVIIIVEVDGASGFRKLHSRVELIHAEGVIRERVEKEARLGLEVPEDNRAVADEHVRVIRVHLTLRVARAGKEGTRRVIRGRFDEYACITIHPDRCLRNIIFFSFYLIDNQLCVHALRESAFIKEELHSLGLGP